MAEILRQGGETVSYALGTITLNADQFGKWTGLVTSLNQSAQTFTVNAKAACQMLADGGIPATVNGASSCNGLTGNLSTVTLGHIWVIANGKAYDPAFKINILKTGIDIPAAMGCGTAAAPTCGAQLETAAMSGATQGTSSGASYIRNVNQASVAAYVQARALSLQSILEAANPTAPIEDAIGGARIDITQPATGAASLPYPSSVVATWAGDIPDPYRTKFRVQFMGIDATLFADELAGKRVRLKTSAPVSSWARSSALFVEGTQVAAGNATGAQGQPDLITVTVDHPFAGATGTYGDTTVGLLGGADLRDSNYSYVYTGAGATGSSGPTDYYSIKLLLLNAGDVGIGTQQHFSKLITDHAEDLIGPHTLVSGAIFNQTTTNRRTEAPSTASNILYQASLAKNIIEQLSSSVLTTFDTTGVLFSQDQGDTQLYSNLAIGAAANSKSAIATDSISAFSAYATVAAALEGSIRQQAEDAFESSASVSMFKLMNDKSVAFYDANSSNISSVLSATTGFNQDRKNKLTALTQQGFSVIIPQSGQIGTVTFPGSGTGSVVYYVAPELAWNTNSIAYLLNEGLKGGGSIASLEPVKSAVESAKAASASVKDKSYYGVDLASGVLNLRPGPDLSTGAAGDLSLAFVRSYSSANDGSLRCMPSSGYNGSYYYTLFCQSVGTGVPTLIGGGWNHSLNITGRWLGNGSEGMGVTSALRASYAIAAIAGLVDLAKSQTFPRQMAGIFTAHALISGFTRNNFVVNRGSDSDSFVSLPSGRMDPPLDSRSAALTISGAPSTPVVIGGSVFRDYQATSVDVTNADGGVIHLTPKEFVLQANGTAGGAFLPQYYADYTIMPTGYLNTLSYYSSTNTITFSTKSFVKDVAASSGSKLSINYGDQTQATNWNFTFPLGYARVLGVSDQTGRTVSYNCTYGADQQNGVFFQYSEAYYSDCSNLEMKFTDSLGGISKYGYASGDGGYSGSVYPDRVIKSWGTPNNPTTPFLNITYDPQLHVSGYTDIAGKSYQAYVTNVAGDRFRRGELKDPTGAIVATVFDENASAVSVTDPLGRVTSNVYDSARRILRTVLPEGNAVEYTYDIRGNKLTECQIAKGRVNWASLTPLTERTPQCSAGAGDLVRTTVYMEGPTVRADQCVTMKTCNKPNYEIDPKGNRITYTWSGTHGQMLSRVSGLNAAGTCTLANGICPTTTYGYTAFTGTDGATFYLLTSKQETIDASSTTMTTWAYRGAADRFVLREQLVYGSGATLRTCFKFDPTGNLISKTEPNAQSPACP